MSALRAVLFDMDGTLTDSEKLWDVALTDVATELGGELPQDVRAAMVGGSMRPSVDLIHEVLGIDRDWRVTATALNNRVAELYVDGVPWRPGAQRLLAEVRSAGLRTALVTSAERILVDVAMATLGATNFDAVVAGDEVTFGKPHPEAYLAAMDLLGVGPEAAVAVEDSPGGTEAAVAAGLAVLVVPCDVSVPGGPGRTFADSLTGVGVATLEALLAER